MKYISLLVGLVAIVGCRIAKVESKAPVAATSDFVLDSTVQNNIDFLYFAIMEKAGLEGGFCMMGSIDSSTGQAHIVSLTPTWVDSASQGSLFHYSVRCAGKQDMLGVLHFHPPWATCDMSEADIALAHRTGYAVAGVVCRPNGSPPRLVLTPKSEFDIAWKSLRKKTSKGMRVPNTGNYMVTYRYKRPH